MAFQLLQLRKDYSTYDFSELTRLVVMAHRFSMRVTLIPEREGMKIVLFERDPQGQKLTDRHPELTEAIQRENEAIDKIIKDYNIQL